MYSAQITKERIKNSCKSQGINMENMLTECSLGVNAIRQINGTKGMASFSLAKIADYLDVSVDYLLGRIDSPNGYYNTQVNSNNSNSYVIGDNNNNTGNDVNNNSSNGLDKNMQEIVDSMKDFSILEQAEIITKINEIKNRR